MSEDIERHVVRKFEIAQRLGKGVSEVFVCVFVCVQYVCVSVYVWVCCIVLHNMPSSLTA